MKNVMTKLVSKLMTKLCVIFPLSFAAASASADNIILINPFQVPEHKLEESINFWEKARDFLKTQPGYVSTKLHSSLQADSEYQLINVAEWRSTSEFKAATNNMRSYFKENKIRHPDGLKGRPSLYSVIRN
jgi:heme-degrading monooxygenase HmoA